MSVPLNNSGKSSYSLYEMQQIVQTKMDREFVNLDDMLKNRFLDSDDCMDGDSSDYEDPSLIENKFEMSFFEGLIKKFEADTGRKLNPKDNRIKLNKEEGLEKVKEILKNFLGEESYYNLLNKSYDLVIKERRRKIEALRLDDQVAELYLDDQEEKEEGQSCCEKSPTEVFFDFTRLDVEKLNVKDKKRVLRTVEKGFALLVENSLREVLNKSIQKNFPNKVLTCVANQRIKEWIDQRISRAIKQLKIGFPKGQSIRDIKNGMVVTTEDIFPIGDDDFVGYKGNLRVNVKATQRNARLKAVNLERQQEKKRKGVSDALEDVDKELEQEGVEKEWRLAYQQLISELAAKETGKKRSNLNGKDVKDAHKIVQKRRKTKEKSNRNSKSASLSSPVQEESLFSHVESLLWKRIIDLNKEENQGLVQMLYRVSRWRKENAQDIHNCPQYSQMSLEQFAKMRTAHDVTEVLHLTNIMEFVENYTFSYEFGPQERANVEKYGMVAKLDDGKGYQRMGFIFVAFDQRSKCCFHCMFQEAPNGVVLPAKINEFFQQINNPKSLEKSEMDSFKPSGQVTFDRKKDDVIFIKYKHDNHSISIFPIVCQKEEKEDTN